MAIGSKLSQAWQAFRNLTRIFRSNSSKWLAYTAGVNFLIAVTKISKYMPFTDGWWISYGFWVNEGRVPYKDFTLLTPPGFVYFSAFLARIGIDTYLEFRLIGIAARLATSLSLFIIFRKVVNPAISSLLATFSTVYLYGGVASIEYDYNYFAVLLILWSVLLLQKGLEASAEKSRTYFFLAGLCAAHSFLIKQSFASAFIFAVGLYFVVKMIQNDFDEVVRRVFWAYGFGILSTLFAWSMFLLLQSNLSEFFSQVFGTSVSSKGDLKGITLGWVLNSLEFLDLRNEVKFAVISGLLVLGIVLIGWKFPKKVAHKKQSRTETLLVVAALSIIPASFVFFPQHVLVTEMKRFLEPKLLPTLFQYNHLLVPLAFIFWSIFETLRKRTLVNQDILLLLISSLIIGGGMSGGVDNFGMFVAFSYLAARIYESLKRFFIMRQTLSVILIFAISVISHNSLERPYSWWGYTVPSVWSANTKSTGTITSGLYADRENFRLFEDVRSFLARNISCEKKGIAFPYGMTLLQDSGYKIVGTNVQYWFDFSTPEDSNALINTLQKSPPPAMIFVELPETVWTMHMKLFNQNQVYPQSKVRSTISLIVGQRYETESFQVPNSPGYVIQVGLREDCLIVE